MGGCLLALLLGCAAAQSEAAARASALVQVGELEAALRIYRELCASAAPAYDLLVSAGFVAQSLGETEEARRFLRAAHEQRPGEVYPLATLGLVAFESGDLDAADALFRQAQALAPGDPRCAADLASVSERRATLLGFARARRQLQGVVALVGVVSVLVLGAGAAVLLRATRRATT